MEPGDKVKIKDPKSHLHGRVGVLRAWKGDMVVVDFTPPYEGDIRYVTEEPEYVVALDEEPETEEPAIDSGTVESYCPTPDGEFWPAG